MSPDLPERLDPIRLCQLRAVIEGTVNFNEFNSLRSFLFDDSSFVSVKLEFFYDEENRAVVAGFYQGSLNLICQRCLGSTERKLNAQPLMAVITHLDQAQDLPDEYEPLLFQDELIWTKDIIEEELLLAVPMVPRCDNEQCTGRYSSVSEERKPDTHRPFEGLDKLIKK